MTSNSSKIRLDSLAKVNPKRSVAKRTEISFIDMAAVPQHSRDISKIDIDKRVAKGAGSHFKNGDTLLARITPCLENGKTAQVNCLEEDEVGEGSTEFIVLCGIDAEDDDYIHYLCRDPRFRDYAVSRMEGTSGRQRVSWQSIAAYEFECPSASDRKNAAEILAAIDNRISLLRANSLTIDKMLQATFKAWFIRFEPVHANALGVASDSAEINTAELFPNSLVESDFGLIPDGWEIKTIGDVIDTFGGATPDTKNESFWSPPVHCWTSPKDLSGLAVPVLLDTERKISGEGLKKISSGLLPVGTLLMSSRAPIGYLAIAQVPIAINQGYIAMTPCGALSPLFMLYWCRANMENIKGRANGSTFMEISKKTFRPIPIVAPSDDVAKAFDEYASTLFEKISENEKHIKTLTHLRETLLPRLISGQLDIAQTELDAIKAKS